MMDQDSMLTLSLAFQDNAFFIKTDKMFQIKVCQKHSNIMVNRTVSECVTVREYCIKCLFVINLYNCIATCS